MERVELKTIYDEIDRLKPRKIALVLQTLDHRIAYGDHKEEFTHKLRSSEDRFVSQLMKMPIQHEQFREPFTPDKRRWRGFDMCVLAGELCYQSINSARRLREKGVKGPFFIEITEDAASNQKDLDIALATAKRYDALDLLHNLVYLSKTKQSESPKWLEFDTPAADDQKHFVTYHNVDVMGYRGDETEINPFSIFTDKVVSHLAGNKVWLISGEGNPRKYSLCNAFVVDEVGKDRESGYKHFASGKFGTAFRPPIPLNDLLWFNDFLRSQQNLRFGLNQIEKRHADALEELAKPAATKLVAAPEDRFKTGAGFGDLESNRKVETAAVSFVTDWYKTRGWHVDSVESERCGYDLLCRSTDVEEHVEVKGVSGDVPAFVITAGEVRQAKENPRFIICVVTSALSEGHQLLRLTGGEFIKRYKLEPLIFRATAHDLIRDSENQKIGKASKLSL